MSPYAAFVRRSGVGHRRELSGSGLAIALLLSVLFPAVAAAQLVHGTLTNASTKAPVEGAFMRLLAEGGESVAAALSREDGSYSIRAPAPGWYRLKIDRIGYITEEYQAFELSESTRLDLEVDWEPIPLEGFSIGGESRCGLPSETGQATALLWDEARKALKVAVWAQERLLEFEVESFQRLLNRSGSVAQEITDSLTWLGAEAFSSVSAEWLDQYGYIQPVEGRHAYFGPDAKLILSETFLRTHCFGTDRSQGRLGLTFEPVPQRELSDIKGTLWFSSDSMFLEELEFRYTRVPNRIMDGRVGGEMTFERLPGGAWIINDWRIRVPLQWHSIDRGPPTVTGYLERGGRILEHRARQHQ